MKTINTLFVFLLCAAAVSAQTPTVTIVGNTVFVEPMQELSYQAVPNNFPSDANSYSCTWEITGTSQTVSYVNQTVSPNMSQYIAKIKWNNTHNASSPKSIKATVKYKRGTSSTVYTVSSTVYGVTVRYLGDVISMTVAGSTLLPNQSKQIACGSQTIAVSVPTPDTDPVVAVVYTWTYPSGWSGPAQSNSPSVSVTASAGGPGTIKVEARRNDGLIKTGMQVSISRPLPTISTVSSPSEYTFCTTGQTLSASATGTNADKFIWTPNSGVLINGSSSPQTVAGSVNISATGSNTYYVQAYSTVCQAASSSSSAIYRKAFYGAPPVPTGTVNGDPQQTPNVVPNGGFLVLNAPEGQYTYNWTVLQGTGSLYPNGGNSANAYPNPFLRIEGKLTNVCGSNWTIFYLSNGSMGFAMAPNPATADEAAIVFNENSASSYLAKSATIYDDKQNKVREYDFTANKSNNGGKSNEFKLNLKGIKPGQYYVHVAIGDKVEKEILVIK